MCALLYAGLAAFASCAGGGNPAAPTNSDAPPAGPPPHLAQLTVLLDPQSIDVGRSAAATVAGVDNVGNRIAVGPVTWRSTFPAVATVDPAGFIAALAPGTTSISATAGTVTAQALFTVTTLPLPPTGVRISPSAATIAFGDSVQLSAATIGLAGDTTYAGPYTWFSSTPSVATVSGSGVVHAIAPGVAVVRAAASGLSGSVAVTVNALVDTALHVNLAAPQPGALVGDTLGIILTVTLKNQIAIIAKVIATVDHDDIPLDTLLLGAFKSIPGWGKHLPVTNYPIGIHRLVITAYAFTQAISADTIYFDREVEQTGGIVPGGGRKQVKPARPKGLSPP